MSLDLLAFGVYPYVALAICLIGSWARFDLSQYTWKAGSSQMLSKKGMRVYVEGRLRTREYEDRNGQKRMAVDIIANDMMMLESRDQSRGGERAAIGESRTGGGPVDAGDDIDEMPF